jgi:hypothetical protein
MARSPCLLWLSSGSEEVVEHAPNLAGTFEIGEMSAILECDELSFWDRLRDSAFIAGT